MPTRFLIVIAIFSLVFGCIHAKPKIPEAIHITAPFERYVEKNYDWTSVRRIVVMPFANQVAAGYPRVGQEMQANLATELQRSGHFDIVVATKEDPMARAEDLFSSGQFNELEVLRISREYQADAVLYANITQYHPYSPPRVGVKVVVLSPSEGIAIASASGVWDTREKTTLVQAQEYFKRTQNSARSLVGSNLVTDSPNIFQRFVCQQLAVGFDPSSIGGSISTGAIIPTAGGMPSDGSAANNGPPQDESMMNNGQTLLPIPPSSMNQ